MLATAYSMSKKSQLKATRLAETLATSAPKAELGGRHPLISAAVLPGWMRTPQSSMRLLPKRMVRLRQQIIALKE